MQLARCIVPCRRFILPFLRALCLWLRLIAVPLIGQHSHKIDVAKSHVGNNLHGISLYRVLRMHPTPWSLLTDLPVHLESNEFRV